jgi:hypothetical protein
MDNSIKIWKYLLPFLQENEDLQAKMNIDNILPLAAAPETKYPIVIYHRDSIETTYTKGIGWSNRVYISLDIYTLDYTEGTEITNIIRNIFENKSLKTDEIRISDIYVSYINESWAEDAYRQTIQFNMTVE